jgi:glycosyltransferase involved in cell wall biosynthesis
VSRPTASVIIASGAGGEFLFRCLTSVREQVAKGGGEIIVVDRQGDATRRRIARECPEVRVVAAPVGEKPTIPQMRRIGVDNAQGEIVVILEEHCTAPPRWFAAMRSGMRQSDAAVGGPILDSAFDRLRDWCVYFSEYHNFLPPWKDGERFMLNGANIAYWRAKLLRYRDVLDSGYWEVVVHPLLAREGAFRALDGMGVRHTGPFDYGYYIQQRYLLSRVWGGTQRGRVSLGRRVLHVVGGPIFPLFLLGRVTQRVHKQGRHVGKYLATLPLLLPVWVAYSWGEWLGYLLGPGTALERVE